MYGVMVTLTAGRCMAELLELRNEYRAAHRGELPMVILSQADYDMLCGEYPVRNYGNVVHGMRVVVVREWHIPDMIPSVVVSDDIADDCMATLSVGSAADDEQWQEVGTFEGISYVKAESPSPTRKKPGRPAKGRK